MNDLARMRNIEQNHHEEHQCRIEDIQVYLVLQQNAILPHNIFCNTEYGSNHDEQRSGVEDVEVPFPWDGERL